MKMRLAFPRPYVALALSALPLCTAACGGEPAAAPPAKAPVAVAVEPHEPKADLSAVPEPANLMLYARVAKPSVVTGVVAGWLRTQMPGVPQPGSEALTEMIAGESLGEIVDMDQPIDMAGAVALQMGKPDVSFAVSAAVKDPAKAKAAFSSGTMKLVPGENGLLRIDGLGRPQDVAEADRDGDDDDDDGLDDRTCALVPSFGVSPLRLVCAFGHHGLAALAPYLTRTTPRLPSSSDVHVDVRFQLVHAFLAENAKSVPLLLRTLLGQLPSAGPAMRDLFTAAATDTIDFARDLDSAVLDVKLTDAYAEATFATKLTGATSLAARVALAHPERVDVAPPAFSRLPADADVATFSRGYDDADLVHPRELLANAIAEGLMKEGVTSADAKALTDALGKLLDASPAVYASGSDDAAVAKALAAAGKPPAKGAASNDLAVRDAVVGYRLLGFEAPPARVLATAKELVAAWARPSLAKWLKSEAAPTPAPTLKLTPLAKNAGLPKDTLHLELTVTPPADLAVPSARAGKDARKAPPPKAPAPTKPTRVHVFVVPDGTRTWIAVGLDDALVASRVRAVLAGAPDAGTLAARPGLEAVRDAKSNGGGFVTIHGLAGSMLTFDLLEGVSPSIARTETGLAGAKHKGATIIPFVGHITPSAAGAAGGTSALTVTVPKAAIEDVIQLGMRGVFKM